MKVRRGYLENAQAPALQYSSVGRKFLRRGCKTFRVRRSTGNRDAGLLCLNCKLDEVAARGRLCVSRIFAPSQMGVRIQFSIIS